MKKLLLELTEIPDPRKGGGRCKHIFSEIIGITILAMFSGARTFNEIYDFGNTHHEWLKQHMRLPFGIPSHDTFNRAIATLSSSAFEQKFRKWSKHLTEECKVNTKLAQVLAFDGKAIRRATDKEKGPILVGVYDATANVVIAQEPVAEKSNEITAVPKLIDSLDIQGKVVTADAMACQKTIARKIINKGGDYMLALKKNHVLAYDEMMTFMTNSAKEDPKELSFFETVEKDHGRIEHRKCWQSSYVSWFTECHHWKGLKSICLVESDRTVKGVSTTEKRLYLSSLPLNAKNALAVIRGHWGIENKIHHKLDVQLAEDYSRARKGNCARNLSLIRRLVLNVLTRINPRIGLNRHQKQIAQSINKLENVIKTFA